MEYNTLESYLIDKLDVPSRERVDKPPFFRKIKTENEIEDFEIFRLQEEKQVTKNTIREAVINFYHQRNVPISLAINTELEIIRENKEIPKLAVNVTYYGSYAAITVQEMLKNQKEKLQNENNSISLSE